MNSKKVDEIMSKVIKVWTERYGAEKIDPIKVKMTRDMLSLSPHEDGFMRVELIGGGCHLVPMEDIILNGLKGSDVSQYEKEGVIKYDNKN